MFELYYYFVYVFKKSTKIVFNVSAKPLFLYDSMFPGVLKLDQP